MKYLIPVLFLVVGCGDIVYLPLDVTEQANQLCRSMDEFKVVDNMSTSICKVWYKDEGVIEMHDDFKLTVASGMMFLNTGYSWSDPHPKKMVEKFKHKFSCSTKDQAKNRVVQLALNKL